jgi:hypothetical protein
MANLPAEYIPPHRVLLSWIYTILIAVGCILVIYYVYSFYRDPETWLRYTYIGLGCIVGLVFIGAWLYLRFDALTRSPIGDAYEAENIPVPPPEGLKQPFPATSDGVGGLLSVEKYQFAGKIVFGYMRYNRIQKNNPAHIKELSDRSMGLLKDFEINLALDQLIAEGQLHLEGNEVKAGEAEIKIIDWTLINNIFEALKCEYWSLDKSLGDERFEIAKERVLKRFKYKSVEKWFDINSELLDVIHTYDEKKAVTTVSYDDVTGELEL